MARSRSILVMAPGARNPSSRFSICLKPHFPRGQKTQSTPRMRSGFLGFARSARAASIMLAAIRFRFRIEPDRMGISLRADFHHTVAHRFELFDRLGVLGEVTWFHL